MNNKIGRNDSCPCGSGKKNKKCHNVDRWPTIVSNKTNII
ncbi:SEC-C metal-binding domain-containing protein [Flavobacterium sp. PLA-1-15]